MRHLGLLVIFLIGFFSCNNSKELSSSSTQNNENVQFTEERRLNSQLNLDEITVIRTVPELVALYEKLNDPNFPRAAPIPLFDEATEFMLVVKPKISTLTYGDIEIEAIQKSASKLIVKYKEIENWEFTENKWKDPVVILRVSGKSAPIELKKQINN